MKRWKRGDIDALSWIILLAGAISVVFYAVVMACLTPAYGEESERPYVDEACQESFACRDVIIYELVYAGLVVGPRGDLTKEECEELKTSIQNATGAMSDLKCRPRLVEREKT